MLRKLRLRQKNGFYLKKGYLFRACGQKPLKCTILLPVRLLPVKLPEAHSHVSFLVFYHNWRIAEYIITQHIFCKTSLQ